jgi:hypothetical protein
MHDLSALETNSEDEEFEDEDMYEGEAEGEDEKFEFEHDEAEELESAAELLSVGSEGELDQFLGGLIRKAARAVGRGVKAATGNSLGGLLKGLARQALPMVATAIGGPVGGLAAKGGLDAAMKAFGLELEGLSEEDQELELARRYVRLANGAARRMFSQRASSNPRAQARGALRWAMQRHAPGMFRNSRWLRGHRRRYLGREQSLLNPGDVNACPPCDPCPTCPECGAATSDAAEPLATAPEKSSEFEFEGGEYQGEDEDEYEAQQSPMSGGRWVRRGNKIIIYGA